MGRWRSQCRSSAYTAAEDSSGSQFHDRTWGLGLLEAGAWHERSSGAGGGEGNGCSGFGDEGPLLPMMAAPDISFLRTGAAGGDAGPAEEEDRRQSRHSQSKGFMGGFRVAFRMQPQSLSPGILDAAKLSQVSTHLTLSRRPVALGFYGLGL